MTRRWRRKYRSSGRDSVCVTHISLRDRNSEKCDILCMCFFSVSMARIYFVLITVRGVTYHTTCQCSVRRLQEATTDSYFPFFFFNCEHRRIDRLRSIWFLLCAWLFSLFSPLNTDCRTSLCIVFIVEKKCVILISSLSVHEYFNMWPLERYKSTQ